jgi:hypothetical protein
VNFQCNADLGRWTLKKHDPCLTVRGRCILLPELLGGRRNIRTLTLATGLVATAALAGCSSTLGDDTYEVSLSYQGDSNHGPANATGNATVVTADGKVDIVVQGLPTLTNELYEGWLAGGDEDPIGTGRFNTDASGAGSSTIMLGDITDRTYERVVITVEPEPDVSAGPDDRHSIQGPIE